MISARTPARVERVWEKPWRVKKEDSPKSVDVAEGSIEGESLTGRSRLLGTVTQGTEACISREVSSAIGTSVMLDGKRVMTFCPENKSPRSQGVQYALEQSSERGGNAVIS
jgi:hypothetical protein